MKNVVKQIDSPCIKDIAEKETVTLKQASDILGLKYHTARKLLLNEPTIGAINYGCKTVRIKRKLSQETLAELCNLSSSYISYIETGKKRLSFATLEKLSKYLNFDIDIYDKNIKKYSNKQAFLKRLITLIEFEFENTHLDL